MLTICEARQRCAINHMRISWDMILREYVVNFVEARSADTEYRTDCLEDAVLTGAKMRRAKRDATAARYAFG
jgi:hypothetical protein